MARNDAMLYTGMTSNTAKKVEQRQALKSRNKREKQVKIAPAAQEVLDLLEKERSKIPQEVMNIIGTTTPDKDVASVVKAFQLYDRHLVSLKRKLNNILRKQIRDESDDEA